MGRCVVFLNYYCAESRRRDLYRAIARESGWDVHVVAPEQWQEQGPLMTLEPEPTSAIVLHSVKSIFGYRAHRVLYLGLVRLLRNLQPDFLYVHTEPENYAMLEALAAIRLASPRTKLGVYSHRMYDYPGTRFPYRLNWTHQGCDAIARANPADLLFYAPHVAREFVAPYARRICYLPYSVDSEKFTPHSMNISAGSAPPTIGYVGRLVEGKGIHLLIDVLPALPPDTRLLIAGEGPLRAQLIRQCKEMGVSERVTFSSGVAYERVPDLLRSLAILVLPSIPTSDWSEQFGRILIEAMSSGIPVVGSDSASIPEVIGEAGVLFKTGDRLDLTQRLKILLSNPGLLEDYSRMGRDRVLKEFETRIIARKIVEEIGIVLDDQPNSL